MSELKLVPVTEKDKQIFVDDVQEAFQLGIEKFETGRNVILWSIE